MGIYTFIDSDSEDRHEKQGKRTGEGHAVKGPASSELNKGRAAQSTHVLTIRPLGHPNLVLFMNSLMNF